MDEDTSSAASPAYSSHPSAGWRPATSSGNGSSPHLLSRDEILGADDLRYAIVDCPEWGAGAQVRVRSISASERDVFEAGFLETSTGKKGAKVEVRLAEIRARMCALAIVDAEGKRLFSLDDVKALGQKSASALDRVYDVARELAGMSDEDEEELVGADPSAASDTA